MLLKFWYCLSRLRVHRKNKSPKIRSRILEPTYCNDNKNLIKTGQSLQEFCPQCKGIINYLPDRFPAATRGRLLPSPYKMAGYFPGAEGGWAELALRWRHPTKP
jgi:hypothetical protein